MWYSECEAGSPCTFKRTVTFPKNAYKTTPAGERALRYPLLSEGGNRKKSRSSPQQRSQLVNPLRRGHASKLKIFNVFKALPDMSLGHFADAFELQYVSFWCIVLKTYFPSTNEDEEGEIEIEH